ncbi:MAG TPA: hypothetical protein VFQ82_08920 [Stellaceae bacterium]|nr:hypothetical protein [Stellaceae bacterium]
MTAKGAPDACLAEAWAELIEVRRRMALLYTSNPPTSVADEECRFGPLDAKCGRLEDEICAIAPTTLAGAAIKQRLLAEDGGAVENVPEEQAALRQVLELVETLASRPT